MAIVAATPEAIEAAAARIRAGEVVAFPTETVYGLGADATNPVAVARIFEIKRRPFFEPLIVHVAEAAGMETVVDGVPEAVQRLISRFWPGPLTVVLPKREGIPDIVTGGLPTVAVRVPDHVVALSLLRQAAVPMAAPSANLFEGISPTSARHVADQIGSQVPCILDGGPCRIGIESTIVSFAEPRPSLLRPGGVALEDIESVVGRVERPRRSAAREASGQSAPHHAPRLPLVLVRDAGEVPASARGGAALLAARSDAAAAGFAHVEVLAEEGDLREAAANLFGALQRLGAGPYERIYAVAVPEVGLGRAIMDRLRRASGGC